MTDADPQRFGLLLGADSLLRPISGIGRLTCEIARQLELRPEIADYALVIGGRVRAKEWLRDTQPTAAHRKPRFITLASARELAARVPTLHRLSATRRRWRMGRQVAMGIGQGGAPVVYHEPNLIPQPYAGVTVTTINDLSFRFDPLLHPADRLRWVERNLPRMLRQTTRFVAVSAFTAQEAARSFGIPRERLDVVYEAAAAQFAPMTAGMAAPVLRRYGVADQEYVLTVATLEPRKNLDRLVAAHQALPVGLRRRYPLLIAGGLGWNRVLAKADAAIAAGEVRLLGYVPDADLPALTARCRAYAFVSIYEGFGLPVVEAMASGAAVLASDNTATGEIAGDGALLVNPLDEGAITTGLRQLLEDDAARAAWAAAGLRRAVAFAWSSTVDQLVASWQQALRA
jgi:glycosyltransferase involved in cell wall biosynthesis